MPTVVHDAVGRRRATAYIPLFWRIFIPNATILAVAGIVLAAEPANGKALVLLAGFLTMIAANVVVIKRSSAPLSRLAALMHDVDPLRPGQRVPVPGPPSEVTLLAEAFNDMLDRLETERRDSARRELAAQQAVRRHVARELHDQLGQDLTALALQLDRLANGTVGDVPGCAAEARDATLQAVETVRVLARQLRPDVLEGLGLKPALAELCRRLSARTGLSIECRLEEAPALDPDAELVVYRVVQESLTNVMRHADASQIRVSLGHDGGSVVAVVEDDGVGLPDGDGAPHNGGILQMRERVLLVHGSLDIESGRDRGTRVRLRIPTTPTP